MNEKIRKIQKGDTLLLEKFLEENNEYILSFTKKYKEIFIDYEDLVSEAKCAFIKAIYNYSFERNYFKQFAHISISSKLKKYIFSNLNRISNKDYLYKICITEYEKCREFYKREIDCKELSLYMNVPIKTAYQIIYIINNIDKIKSNNSYKEQAVTYEDKIIEKIETENFKNKFLSTLTDKQREVILKEFGFINNECIIREDISKIMGISRQAIEDRRDHAIKKLVKKHHEELKKYNKEV